MTNNQAIEALLRIRCIIREDSLEEQALVYAIEALEGKDTDVPSNDTISRQADRLMKYGRTMTKSTANQTH